MENESPEMDEIQVLLTAAYEDETKFPFFYQKLMNGQLIFVPESPVPKPGDEKKFPLTNLQIKRYEIDGTFYVPVFSSPEIATNCFKKDLKLVKAPTTEIFRMLNGYPVVLNFGLRDNKLFSREEIQWLLEVHAKSQAN